MSDPSLRAAERPHSQGFDAAHQAALSAVRSPASISALRRVHRWWIYSALTGVSALLGLRLLASVVAAPLDVPANGAAPAWQVEVTTNGSRPGVALAYGREVGIQLLRIPAGSGSASDARVVPARLARGELHLVTLSLTSLRVHAPGVPGSGVVALSAQAPMVTVFQKSSATGVRIGW